MRCSISIGFHGRSKLARRWQNCRLRPSVPLCVSSSAPPCAWNSSVIGWRSGGGRRAVDDKGRHAGAAELLGQRRLRLEELGEDDRAAFPAGERREQLALALPARLQRRLLAPGARGGAVRELLQRLAPRRRAAAGRLQQQPAPEAGLARAELRQAGAEFRLPLLPEGALGFVRLEQNGLGAARRQLDAGVGARVANHHLAEQAAQFLRLARLARALRVNEARAELLRRRQLARLQQRDQVVEFFERVLDRRGGEQQQELARQGVDRLPGLRLAVAQVMRLVHDQHVPVHLPGDLQMRGLFERVQAGDEARVLAPELLPRRRAPRRGWW